MKTAEGRSRKIEQLVDMLARGETIIPQRQPAAKRAASTPARKRSTKSR
jgi:hypothetical protein